MHLFLIVFWIRVAATRNHVAKCFPITSSESDLQKYRMSALWDPTASVSNIHSESIRHKVSVAQVSTLEVIMALNHIWSHIALIHGNHGPNSYNISPFILWSHRRSTLRLLRKHFRRYEQKSPCSLYRRVSTYMWKGVNHNFHMSYCVFGELISEALHCGFFANIHKHRNLMILWTNPKAAINPKSHLFSNLLSRAGRNKLWFDISRTYTVYKAHMN